MASKQDTKNSGGATESLRSPGKSVQQPARSSFAQRTKRVDSKVKITEDVNVFYLPDHPETNRVMEALHKIPIPLDAKNQQLIFKRRDRFGTSSAGFWGQYASHDQRISQDQRLIQYRVPDESTLRRFPLPMPIPKEPRCCLSVFNC